MHGSHRRRLRLRFRVGDTTYDYYGHFPQMGKLPDGAYYLQTVHPRQQDVHDDQVEVLGVHDL